MHTRQPLSLTNVHAAVTAPFLLRHHLFSLLIAQARYPPPEDDPTESPPPPYRVRKFSPFIEKILLLCK